MKLILFLLIFTGFFLLFHEMRALEYAAEALKRTREGVDAAARQRSLADRQQLQTLQEEHSFWYSVERLLQYSGVRGRFSEITAEWWIVGNVAAGAVIFLAVDLVFRVKAAAAAVLFCGALEWYALKKLRERNLRRTERNLMKLLDFLGNYSVTAGEITGIFRQVSRYVEEPVKGALELCCYETAATGDAEMALRLMAERIEHPKFKELARNMEISMRYSTDFSALVESSRRSLREYLKVAQERRGMVREAIIHLALLMGMSAVALVMVEKLTGIGVRQLVISTWPGRAGAAALLLIFAAFRNHMYRAD